MISEQALGRTLAARYDAEVMRVYTASETDLNVYVQSLGRSERASRRHCDPAKNNVLTWQNMVRIRSNIRLLRYSSEDLRILTEEWLAPQLKSLSARHLVAHANQPCLRVCVVDFQELRIFDLLALEVSEIHRNIVTNTLSDLSPQACIKFVIVLWLVLDLFYKAQRRSEQLE